MFQGTIYFMAVEVDGHEYMFSTPNVAQDEGWEAARSLPDFKSRRSVKQSQDEESPTPQQDKNGAPLRPCSPKEKNEVSFLYNSLHDMESLWWLANFLVFPRRLKVTGSKITIAQRKAQFELTQRLFSDPKLRLQTFISPSGLTHHLGSLHPRVAEIGRELETMHWYLTTVFGMEEKGLEGPVPFSAAQKLYPKFERSFNAVIHLLRRDDIHVSAETRKQPKVALRKKDRETQSVNVETASVIDEATPIPEDSRPTKRTKTRD